MFTHYRTQGLIIKKINYREADRIFIIYTQDFGKLKVLARAERKIKSKLRAGLKLFYLSEIEFIQGKNHKTLTDVILTENFKNIRNDLSRLKIAYKISEVLDNFLTFEQKDEKIWNLLNKTLEELNHRQLLPARYLLLYYYFLWNFLIILGYKPELYNCCLCRKKLILERLHFSNEEGGIICKKCFKTFNKSFIEICPETIKILRFILKQNWQTFKRLNIKEKNKKELKTISNYFLESIH